MKKLLLFIFSLWLVSASLLAQLKVDVDSIIMETCPGASNGVIMITVSGGITPYSFHWVGQGLELFTEDIFSIPSGLYNLTVIDSVGATVEEKFIEVGYNNPISISVEKSQYVDYGVSCNGCSDGWIEVISGTGCGDYQEWDYLWTDPNGFTKSGLSVDGLHAGDYLLEIKDTAGCPWSDTIELTQPDAPIYSDTVTVWDTIHVTVYDTIQVNDTVYSFMEVIDEVIFKDILSEENLTIYNYGDYLLTDKMFNSAVIYNILGSKVNQAELTNKIPVSELEPGIYLFVFKMDSGTVFKKKIYIE